MKNLRFICGILLFNLAQLLIAQPAILWQKNYGGSSFDWSHSVAPTSDGGVVTIGESNSDISGDKTENTNGGYDFWVLKLDASGNLEWQNDIGGSGADYAASIRQTADGGYIMVGYSNSPASGDKTESSLSYDIWVVKLDGAGTLVWENTICAAGDEIAHEIAETSDGGYIIAAQSNSNIGCDKTENSHGGWDYWVIKLDASGAIVWQNTIGGSNMDVGESVIPTTDGGYLVGGNSQSNISGDKTQNGYGNGDYWIVKLNSTGGILWQTTIGGNNYENRTKIVQAADGYVISGISASGISGNKTVAHVNPGSGDYYIVKINLSGGIVWQKDFGSSGHDYYPSIWPATGGYLISGMSNGNISGSKTQNCRGDDDMWLLKIDLSGNLIWDKTLGGSSFEASYERSSICQTTDGGIVVSCLSGSGISGDKTVPIIGGGDVWVIKLGAALPLELIAFQAKPQPAGDQIEWQTASEIALSHFIIQQSNDGLNFEDIAEIKAIGPNNYRFLNQKTVQNDRWYRLKSVDENSSFEFSKIIHLAATNTKSFHLGENPIGETLQIYFENDFSELPTEAILTTTDSKIIWVKTVPAGSEEWQIPMEDVSSGVYFLKMQTERTVLGMERIYKH
jgi:hypothetical protein